MKRSCCVLTSLVLFLSIRAYSQNWPSFRGPNATGIANGQNPPTTWNLETSQNVKWKTPIPGLAHSSPIIWDDRIFITTVISSDIIPTFELATSGRAVTGDSTKLQWKIYGLQKSSGKIIWEQTAYQGLPRAKRHRKSSQCNSTPVTDGRFVATVMGSEGLYCYDVEGKLLWQKDLGILDGGYVGKPWFQWGHGSSPVIYKNMVIVQIDKFEDSYLAAYDVKDGNEIWSVARTDIPTWSTPTIFERSNRVELITNGGNYARGYDPMTGRELWRFADHAEVKVPTPFVANGLIYLSGGAPRGRQMIAIRVGGDGDISMQNAADSNSFVAWQIKSGGPYTVTPIVYDKLFYTCTNSGILACYDANTGERIYRTRLGSGFSASPVAADGKLYFASEDGIVHVVKAGPAFEVIAKNDMGEACMATPAISDGMIFIRTRDYIYALGA